MDLIYAVRTSFGPDAARNLKEFFGRARLPIPQYDEYYDTTDEGFLVGLDDLACTMRLIDDQEFPTIIHPRISQPLNITKLSERLRVEINGGVICPIPKDHVVALANDLRIDGLEIDKKDQHRFNGADLPAPDNIIPAGYHILIDPGAVKRLADSIHLTMEDLKGTPQDILHGELRREFTRALAENDMDAAWQKCRDMKQQGRLVTSWLDLADSLPIKGFRQYAARTRALHNAPRIG